MCIPYGKTLPLVQKINIATYIITFDLMLEKRNLTFIHYLLMWIDNSFILHMYTHGKKKRWVGIQLITHTIDSGLP